MLILYSDADYVHENTIVLLPIFPSPWEIMRGEGKIPRIVLTMIPGDNTKCFASSSFSEIHFKWFCLKIMLIRLKIH